MKKYIVRISRAAQDDIFQVINHISLVYKAPHTAERYLIQLYDTIFSLENFAESIAPSTKNDILKYGLNARSLVFKKINHYLYRPFSHCTCSGSCTCSIN